MVVAVRSLPGAVDLYQSWVSVYMYIERWCKLCVVRCPFSMLCLAEQPAMYFTVHYLFSGFVHKVLVDPVVK